MTNPTRPPRPLSEESKRLWRSVLAEDGLTTTDRYGGLETAFGRVDGHDVVATFCAAAEAHGYPAPTTSSSTCSPGSASGSRTERPANAKRNGKLQTEWVAMWT